MLFVDPIFRKNGQKLVLQLKNREVWTCPDGFAAVFYKGKVLHLNSSLEIIDDTKWFMKSECSRYNGGLEDLIFFDEGKITQSVLSQKQVRAEGALAGALELQEKRKLRVNPTDNELITLAGYGLDNAVKFLSCSNSKRKKEKIKVAITLRPRFQKILELDVEKLEADVNSSRILFKGYMDLPFKFFLSPIGKGHFGKLADALDRSLKIGDVISIINSDLNIPQQLNVRNFRRQASAALLFHSEIAKSYAKVDLDRGAVGGLFDTNGWREFIDSNQEKLLEVAKNIPNLKEHDGAFNKAVARVSKTAPIRLSSWRKNTFSEFYNLANDLPRHLQLAERRVDLFDDNYPKEVQKLSIFVLKSITKSNSMKQKYMLLHQVGIRHIGDLTMFHPDLFGLLFRK